MVWEGRIKAAQRRGAFTAADKKQAARPDLRGIIALGYLPEGELGARAERLGFLLADSVHNGQAHIARAAEQRLRLIVGSGGVL